MYNISKESSHILVFKLIELKKKSLKLSILEEYSDWHLIAKNVSSWEKWQQLDWLDIQMADSIVYR